jgi:hypothetical protein
MKVFDELLVRIMPEEYPGAPLKCRVIVKVGGKIEHNFEHIVRPDWFESEFHRFMHIAEEEIVKLAKKEEDDATKSKDLH